MGVFLFSSNWVFTNYENYITIVDVKEVSNMTNEQKKLDRISTAADMLEELAVENEKLASVFEKALSRAEAYRFAANWIRQILGDK